ncbi:MAG: MotA/TolQ/Exb proton channel [Desulfobacterales bacterium]|nr:MotA/TolQ/Exb proton channel [Desulfobacterales bacterium]
MRWSVWICILAMAFLAGVAEVGRSEDMRAANREAREKQAALLERARAEEAAARKEAGESRKKILADRKALKSEIARLKAENKGLDEESKRLEADLKTLSAREKELIHRQADMAADVRELVGFVRAGARDLDALLTQSPQSAFIKDRGGSLTPIMGRSEFPGMDDIRGMADLLFDEIQRSGEVRMERGPLVNRAGEETEGDILAFGNFSAAYRLPGEVGFLIYSDKSQRLFALSRLPRARHARKIEAYMAGKSEDAPIDISRGAALRQLTHELSLMEQIPRGGPIVWPIVGVAAFALLIILERILYLARKGVNTRRFTDAVVSHASRGEWEACEAMCEKKRKKPIPRVLLAGVRCRHMNREDLENALQEAILNEIPRLERFLSTLGMLAAIAPLLGLLGTVTGMINTFHVITWYGAGDPRMMSGGISEALVTTMLGLSAAIPIMLCHTLLSRKVENVIARMEEKSVVFVNTIFRRREGIIG